jgi:hypothetical protein
MSISRRACVRWHFARHKYPYLRCFTARIYWRALPELWVSVREVVFVNVGRREQMVPLVDAGHQKSPFLGRSISITHFAFEVGLDT